MKLILLFCCLILPFNTVLFSQSGFSGSGVIGLNAAQIDGDDLVGYKKMGLTAGIKVSFDLKKRLSGNMEILYSQRGSSAKIFDRSSNVAYTNLNYFELPVYLSIKDWYIENGSYYKMKAHLGLSYASLISSAGKNEPYSRDEFNKSDLSYIVGASFNFTEDWALTARFTRSISKLVSDESIQPSFYLLGYFWTIRAEYQF